MRGLKGKVAIVTGGASGIGRAICLRLGEEGCRVGIFDKNGAGAAETARAIGQAGGQADAVPLDITDYAAVGRAVKDYEAKAGPVDILVNNAGWDKLVNFLDSQPDFWELIIAINLKGALNLTHHVVRGMSERKHGRVVNIASDAGRVGSSGEAVYSACKGGIIAFTKTMARELARRGVTLNAVCPGPTDTPLFANVAEGETGEKIKKALEHAIPLKRLGRPDDLPGAVAFLASDDAGFITGQVLSVSGGLTMHG
jgi:2-hydroxycyclohexanecarboxyl-CoA dehydrogenase